MTTLGIGAAAGTVGLGVGTYAMSHLSPKEQPYPPQEAVETPLSEETTVSSTRPDPCLRLSSRVASAGHATAMIGATVAASWSSFMRARESI